MTDAASPGGVTDDPIRVAIVDDHPALREGTAALLAREPGLAITGLYASMAEAEAGIGPDRPADVLVLDVRLGGESGLELLRRWSSGPARPRIIVWTAFDYPQYASYAMAAGAAGFVTKTAPVAELIGAIRTAASGGLHFSRRPAPLRSYLTDRERRVLAGVVEGRSNDEIGAAMGVTTRTVESHLTRLYERFEVRSRTELATRAVREGWLDLPGAPGPVGDARG